MASTFAALAKRRPALARKVSEATGERRANLQRELDELDRAIGRARAQVQERGTFTPIGRRHHLKAQGL